MKPTTDEVLAWAREAGGWQQWEARVMTPQVLERFAALAYAAGAAAMKERAAKVCDSVKKGNSDTLMSDDHLSQFDVARFMTARDTADDCSRYIRALGDDDV